MEAVYFYETKCKKDMDKLMDDDLFKRIGPIERDAKLLGGKRNSGLYLYIKVASEEVFKEAVKKLEESKIETAKLSGEEEKMVIEAIQREEDEAASGMGAIFG